MIILTDAAVNHIKTLMVKKPDAKGFRLSIKKTGCSGYAYVPEIVTTVNASDNHFIAQQSLSVYIDSASIDLLEGVTVDYVVEETQGLKQKRLVFINSREKGRCGCGESFNA